MEIKEISSKMYDSEENLFSNTEHSIFIAPMTSLQNDFLSVNQQKSSQEHSKTKHIYFVQIQFKCKQFDKFFFYWISKLFNK